MGVCILKIKWLLEECYYTSEEILAKFEGKDMPKDLATIVKAYQSHMDFNSSIMIYTKFLRQLSSHWAISLPTRFFSL